jgi:hypothetical protein
MHEAALFDPEGVVADATLCGVGDGRGDEGAADDGDRQTEKGSNEGNNFGAVLKLGKMADKGHCCG